MIESSDYVLLPALSKFDVQDVAEIAGSNSHLFQGFCAERCFALWLEENGYPGSYMNCVLQQKRGPNSRTDLLSIDIKSTDGSAYKKKTLRETLSLGLQVKYETLANESIPHYGCVVFFQNRAYFAGWASREEILAAAIPAFKMEGLRLNISSLHPLQEYLDKYTAESSE